MAPASRRKQVRFLKAACLACTGLLMAGVVCDSKYPRCGNCSSEGKMCEFGDPTQMEEQYRKRKAEVAALRTQQRRETRAQRDAQSGFASESENSISESVSRSSMSPEETLAGIGAGTRPGESTEDEQSLQPPTNPPSTNADAAKPTNASATTPAISGSNNGSLHPTSPDMATSAVHESVTSDAAFDANMDIPQPMTPPSSMSSFEFPTPPYQPHEDNSNVSPQSSGSSSSTLSDPPEFLEDPFSGVALNNTPMPDDQEHHTSSKRSHHTDSEFQDEETSPAVKQDRTRVKRRKRTDNTSSRSRVPDATRLL